VEIIVRIGLSLLPRRPQRGWLVGNALEMVKIARVSGGVRCGVVDHSSGSVADRFICSGVDMTCGEGPPPGYDLVFHNESVQRNGGILEAWRHVW